MSCITWQSEIAEPETEDWRQINRFIARVGAIVTVYGYAPAGRIGRLLRTDRSAGYSHEKRALLFLASDWRGR